MIKLIVIGDDIGYYEVGRNNVKSIEEYQVNGEMAHVNWYRVIFTNTDMLYEVNGKYVSRIARYPAQQQSKDGE